ncbi:MAG: RNA-binding protein [Bacillales bacterium]|jgi:RNA-binding protein YlmH|nr:RNA-binding protein [Bacillales bacterium]
MNKKQRLKFMEIYQHFRKEEREFIDKILDAIDRVSRNYEPKLMDFVDPREQDIAKSIVGNQSEVKLYFFGGNQSVERKRLILCPDFYEPTNDDFQVSVYKIQYPSKFAKLEHRQVMGTLLNLGITRGKFGDIIISDGEVFFVAAQEIVSFLENNISKMGKMGVTLSNESIDVLPDLKEDLIEINTTVSSMRLDVVISAVSNWSRQNAQLKIKQGHAQVNYKTIENCDFEIKVGDLVSVRGFGRMRILDIEGQTKKQKWRLRVGKNK